MAQNREKIKRKQPEPVDDDDDDDQEENWCFECKDGGQLVICDHENCGKAYHSDCVGKDDSFFDTVESWVCGRHCCYNCSKRSKFCCLGCPNAVCKKCVSTSEFTLVRGVQGLCCDCLEIVKIIELKLDHDSEGVGVIITLILEYLPNLFLLIV
ncbi:putative chromatin regulator PHD family [Medicago truncatula]|uniref:Putative chromatin regulator PHD family n=1 Tax=Medicago truncatula TaxID=3880 RepID=A0A396H854_MEDTR|nr:putative chromatin regulator PHD family [Medicago truncatula]